MRRICSILLTLTSLQFAGTGASPQKQKPPSAEERAKQAANRGIAFLENDALKWKKERQCSTCHHGAMTAWALSEAKERHYPATAGALTEISDWNRTKFLGPTLDQPRDTRPGWSIVSLAALYISSAGSNSLSADERTQMAAYVARHQEPEGYWSAPPATNGPPPMFESQEVMSLWALLAMGSPETKRENADSRIAESCGKAVNWLSKAETGDTTQVSSLRLVLDSRAHKPGKALRKGIDRLLKQQNADGGWSQTKVLPSDAFATGQALYALSEAGFKSGRAQVKRGVAFLVANQKEDGSWPMTPRTTPERPPSKNASPIIHAGSAWAVMGLVRSLPENKEQH